MPGVAGPGIPGKSRRTNQNLPRVISKLHLSRGRDRPGEEIGDDDPSSGCETVAKPLLDRPRRGLGVTFRRGWFRGRFKVGISWNTLQIFATCATFYLPLLVILFLYWRIFQAARKRIRKRPGTIVQPPRERKGILRLVTRRFRFSPRL